MRGSEGHPTLDLTVAAAAGGVVAWVLDLRTGRLTWSDGLTALLDLDPREVGSQADLVGLVHPDDVAGVFSVVERAVSDSKPFQLRFRLAAHDGWRWVELVGRRMQGETVLTGTVTDVTDAVIAEAAVFDSIAHAQATLDVLGVVTWDWDLRRATVTTAIYGAEPWTAQLWDGMRPEREFFALFAAEDRGALHLLVGGAAPCTLRLRLAPEVGGFPVKAQWRRRAEGDVTRRLLGVALPD